MLKKLFLVGSRKHNNEDSPATIMEIHNFAPNKINTALKRRTWVEQFHLAHPRRQPSSSMDRDEYLTESSAIVGGWAFGREFSSMTSESSVFKWKQPEICRQAWFWLRRDAVFEHACQKSLLFWRRKKKFSPHYWLLFLYRREFSFN